MSARPVQVIEPARTRVVIAGCGGTGAYVLQSVCRLLYSIREANAAARKAEKRRIQDSLQQRVQATARITDPDEARQEQRENSRIAEQARRAGSTRDLYTPEAVGYGRNWDTILDSPLGKASPPLTNTAHETSALAGGSLPSSVPEVVLVEGGTVSERNVLRQGYLPQDVGRNKAMVLAERYGAAYGMAIHAHAGYITEQTDFEDLVAEGSIVIGCLDNAASRGILHKRLIGYEDLVYLDSGNGAVPMPGTGTELDQHERKRLKESGYDGQVVAGVRKEGRTILPFPGEAFPELIEVADADDRHPEEIPCNEVAASAPQRMVVNLMAANVVLSYLYPLLTEGALLNCNSYFDARQNYVRSTPAIDELEILTA